MAGQRSPRARSSIEAERLGRLADAALEAIAIDRDGLIVDVNRAFVDLVGRAAAALEGRPLADLFAEGDRSLLAGDVPGEGGADFAGAAVVRPDGSTVPVEVVRRSLGRSGVSSGAECATVLRALRPRESAGGPGAGPRLVDEITGLPNRQMFVQLVAAALARGVRDGSARIAIVVIDVRPPQAIVESFGRTVGDGIIASVGRRFADVMRPEEVLAHLGDGQFAVLAPAADGETGANQLAGRLLKSLWAPFAIGDRIHYLGAYAGIVVTDAADATPTGLLNEASIALDLAKADPGSRVATYSPDLSRASAERISLESELRRALDRGELEVFYQPLIDLGTGAIVSHEALVRWRHPTDGLLSPYRFVPLAEETGLIIPLGEQVLVAACRQTRAWQRLFPLDPPLGISVNVSALALAQPGATGSLLDALGGTGLSPRSLEMEITETIVMRDPDEAVRILGGLHDVGIKLGLDDFGTGYSSLAYISRLPFDTIKVDRAFVTSIETSGLHQSIISAVVALAKGLHADVLAEGIERQEELDTVVALGCHRGQGYIFGKPVPADEAEGILARMYG